MLNIIYSELLKLKKTYIIPAVLIGGTIMTVIMFLARLITIEHDMPFERYVDNINQINFSMLYVLLFSMMSAYVFSREFTDKTASTLYAYSFGRIKIFASKLIAIYILVFITYAIETISIPLSYYLLYGIFPEWNLIMKSIKANTCSLMFQLILVLIPILIANISKNIVVPAVYGILALIATIFAVSNDIGNFKYIPISSPYLSSAYFYTGKDIDFNYIVIPSILCFILFMSICIYEFNKKDID